MLCKIDKQYLKCPWGAPLAPRQTLINRFISFSSFPFPPFPFPCLSAGTFR